MKLAVSQMLKRSAALVLLACLASAMAFAQIYPGNKVKFQQRYVKSHRKLLQYRAVALRFKWASSLQARPGSP